MGATPPFFRWRRAESVYVRDTMGLTLVGQGRNSLSHTLWTIVLLFEHRSTQYGYSRNLWSRCIVLCNLRIRAKVEYGGDTKGPQLFLSCFRELPETLEKRKEKDTPCCVIPESSPLRYMKPDRVTCSSFAAGIMPRSRTLQTPSTVTNGYFERTSATNSGSRGASSDISKVS
jgi:hypothetical protein